jgi:hypothetical protein
MYSWITQYQALAPANLIVRAQAVPVFDTGQLTYPRFYERQDSDSIKLRDIVKPIWRPVADRREWSGNGRPISPKTSNIRDMEMIPIAPNHTLGEYEMQRLLETNGGNAEMARKALGVDVQSRVELLAMAAYYRLEVDANKSWCDGTIVVRDPDTGTATTYTLPVDSGRYTTAGTAWNNAGVNAFTAFVNWLKDGQDTIGAIEGVRLRRATFNEIQADAPAAIFRIANQVAQIGTNELMRAVEDMIGGSFYFDIVEGTVDLYTGQGSTTAKTKLWTAQKVAAIPAGGRIGSVYHAPVLRSMDLALNLPQAKIDVRDVSIFPIVQNEGKDLKLDGQLNALPIPDDQLLWVIDAGV